MLTEFYKDVQSRYDQLRDVRIIDLDYDMDSGHIDKEQYLKLKDESRWEIAWQIFDDVNKELGANKRLQDFWPFFEEIDLHCLDIEEAQAITKQKIFECAENL